MESCNQVVDYDTYFYTIWEFCSKHLPIFSVEKITDLELAPYGNIPIYSPVGLKLPFYVWKSEKPTAALSEIGWGTTKTLLRSLPTAINVFLALNSITASGRIGVCIRHTELEKLSNIGTRRILTPLSFLRSRKLITWCFTDEFSINPEAKSVVPIKIFWVNRKRILI